MSTINASVPRNTRFEIRTITQGPNSFHLVCTPRDVPPDVVVENGREVLRALRSPDLEVPEEDFTDEEMQQVHAVLELLEEKFAVVFDRWANAPARIVDVVNETVEAEKQLAAKKAELEAAKAEAARIEAENIVRRAEAEELERNLAAIRAAATETAEQKREAR